MSGKMIDNESLWILLNLSQFAPALALSYGIVWRPGQIQRTHRMKISLVTRVNSVGLLNLVRMVGIWHGQTVASKSHKTLAIFSVQLFSNDPSN